MRLAILGLALLGCGSTVAAQSTPPPMPPSIHLPAPSRRADQAEQERPATLEGQPPPAPFQVADPLSVPLSELEAQANGIEPYALFLLALMVRQDGREEDALVWMTVGRIRAFAYSDCFGGSDPSGLPALTGAVHFTVRQELDAVGRADFRRWATAIDRAIAWEAGQPVFWNSGQCDAMLVRYREAMGRMKDAILRQADGEPGAVE